MIYKLISTLLLGLIRFYQIAVSPMLGSHCRHTPTCSAYTAEALREWGLGKGLILGIKRISRCHPWGTSGYDPVPERKPQSDKSQNA